MQWEFSQSYEALGYWMSVTGVSLFIVAFALVVIDKIKWRVLYELVGVN